MIIAPILMCSSRRCGRTWRTRRRRSGPRRRSAAAWCSIVAPDACTLGKLPARSRARAESAAGRHSPQSDRPRPDARCPLSAARVAQILCAHDQTCVGEHKQGAVGAGPAARVRRRAPLDSTDVPQSRHSTWVPECVGSSIMVPHWSQKMTRGIRVLVAPAGTEVGGGAASTSTRVAHSQPMFS